MARLYINRYSSGSLDYSGDPFYDSNTKNDSISLFPKNNSSKENIELDDINPNSQSFGINHSAKNSFKFQDINKVEFDKNVSNSTKTLSSLSHPLLIEKFQKIQRSNTYPRYKVEKYDDHCIEESKIEYIECLLEEQNKNFFYYLLTIITLGIFALILEIYPLIKAKFSYLRARITNASHFFIKCNDGKYYIKKAYEIKLPRLNNNNLVNLTKLPIIATHTKFFEFKLHKYAFSPELKNFVAVTFKMSANANYEVISRKMIGGLSDEEINYQKIFIYKNKYINNALSVKDMIETELSNPFYLIQLFCIIIFIIINYSLYCKILIFSTILILLYTLYETQSHIYYVNNLVSYSCEVSVKRKMNKINMNSDNLVPGDILIFPENDFILPCDVLLMTGTCIVNESFLSGESNPVFKSHIPKNGDKFNKNDQKYILYSGTKLLQSKNDAIGLVIGVGFDTEKGKLIRSILFSEDKRELERKNKERLKIIIQLLIISLIGVLFSIRAFLNLKASIPQIAILFLELITNLLPSAITISITIGIYFSFIRLKKQGISCLDRNKIDIAGNVDTICFDKTGTLTEDHVEAYGCRTINFAKKIISFGNFVDELEEMSKKTLEFYMNNFSIKSKEKILDENIKQKNINENLNINTTNNINNNNKSNNVDNLTSNRINNSNNKINYNTNNINDNNAEHTGNNNYFLKIGQSHQERNLRLRLYFIEALATCNSLTKINGNIIGETIDLEMLKSVGWTFEECSGPFTLGYYRPKEELLKQYSSKKLETKLDDDLPVNSLYQLDLIKRFDFVSKLQRMSVLVKNSKEDYFKVYCKGSPEKIRELCKPETIPSNYNRILNSYSNQGLRVFALSFKLLKMHYLQSEKLSRESVEHDLVFLGFFIVKNKLRPKTKKTIEILTDVEINTLMSTGDNVFTAASVAKECHIVPDDQIIYRIDVIPISDSDTYELTCKELIVDSIDDDDEEEEEESLDDEFEYKRKLSNRDISKLEVESVSDDDLESSSYSYEENDIHRIFKMQKVMQLKSLKIPENKIKEIKPNSCFAITGSTFKILYDLSQRYLNKKNEENKEYHDIFIKLIDKTLVFARMQPEHKTLLIKCLQKQNKIVAMCGDGANDIGALRSADVGISLGADQVSASAHFMSTGQEIKCLLKLLCEGKACVSNFLACYKFMLLLCFIEFSSCVFLFQLGSILTNNQTILADLFIILPNSILISLSKPSTVLVEQRRLYIKANSIFITIISHGAIMLIFQIIIYGLMINQNWYHDHEYYLNLFKENKNINGTEFNNNFKIEPIQELRTPCCDNTILFMYYYLQCIITIIMFSLDTPYKKELSQNKYLVIYLVANVLFAIYIIFIYNTYIYGFFGLIDIENQNFKFTIIVVAIINFFVSVYTEKKLLKYEEEKKNTDTEEITLNEQRDTQN